MPYANNEGVRIHYEVEGEGPPLVLQHGFSGSIESWRARGYVDGLKNDYRLILIDARGHGASDKPHDPRAYDTKLRVGDVLAVLDDLNISKADFFGYSMGGHIGFGIAKYAPERFHSLVIGGMNPYKPDPERYAPRIRLLGRGMEAYVTGMGSQSGPVEPVRRAQVLANDAEALRASLVARRDEPGLDDILSTLNVPCLVFVGEEDTFYPGAKECVKHMSKGTFVSYPGLDHVPTIERSDLVLPDVTRFLADVSRAST